MIVWISGTDDSKQLFVIHRSICPQSIRRLRAPAITLKQFNMLRDSGSDPHVCYPQESCRCKENAAGEAGAHPAAVPHGGRINVRLRWTAEEFGEPETAARWFS